MISVICQSLEECLECELLLTKLGYSCYMAKKHKINKINIASKFQGDFETICYNLRTDKSDTTYSSFEWAKINFAYSLDHIFMDFSAYRDYIFNEKKIAEKI